MSTSIPSIVTKPIPERVISSLPFSTLPGDDGRCFSLFFFVFEFFLPMINFYDCFLKF